MDRQDVISKVVETVRVVQETSGRPCGNIGTSTCPIRDLEGFDSISGVEATVILSESLGCQLPDSCNPFVSEDGHRALSIIEIADNICALVGGEANSDE